MVIRSKNFSRKLAFDEGKGIKVLKTIKMTINCHFGTYNHSNHTKNKVY